MKPSVCMGRSDVCRFWGVAILWIVLTAGIALAGETIRLGEKDKGSAVEVNCGDRLEVVLPANPTTGYAWEVSSLDGAVLTAAGEGSFRPDSGLIGSGGMMTLAFDAVASGRTVLRLIYHRTFEKGIAPLRIFEIDVIVKPLS